MLSGDSPLAARRDETPSRRRDRALAQVRWRIEPFVDGVYRPSEADTEFENIDPATERVLCRVAAGVSADVDYAVAVAKMCFEDGRWSSLGPTRRAEVLLKLADLLAENYAELALLDCLEMGKPIQASRDDARVLAPSLLRSWVSFIHHLVGQSVPLSDGRMSFNVFEPVGVVAAITPWNFPSVNAIYKLGPALAAGNTVVLKPSELSSSSALRIAELALEAGVPEGVLNVVPGLGSTIGEALALHPDVDLVSFTGSTPTGRRVMELAGKSNGKRLLLECGGKSPHVVFADVEDLDAVADHVTHGFVWNQGQVCSAHTRLIVEDSIRDVLVEKVAERASTYRPSDPLDECTTFGPLASPSQRDRVQRFVTEGVEVGAEPVLLGEIQSEGGCFVSPTIFSNVMDEMNILRDEIFGPVLCVQRFSTEKEALELANGTSFGLVATVWTRDLGRARLMAHRLRAGRVSVRTSGAEGDDPGYVLSREPQKGSGFGCELGLRGLESYSILKAVSLDGA